MRARHHINPFDELACVSRAAGAEFWYAREIMPHLGYVDWDNFANVIKKAESALLNSGLNVKDHIRDATEMVDIGSGARRAVPSFALTRLGCYLVAMNGDPRKQQIADAQTYFAHKTRERELDEEESEFQARVRLRERNRRSNRSLSAAAHDAGVQNYGRFYGVGYQALYGLSLKEIKAMKGIAENDDLLDCIGRAELAANDFKSTQTELRLRAEKVSTEAVACQTHKEVGLMVRDTMYRASGTYPEQLPAQPSLKRLPTRTRPAISATPRLDAVVEEIVAAPHRQPSGDAT